MTENTENAEENRTGEKRKTKACPYIGITGFKTAKEVDFVTKAAEMLGFDNLSNYKIMYGFLTSSKRFQDFTKEGRRSPAICNIPKLLSSVPNYGLPVLHYNTWNGDKISDELIPLFSYENI